MAEILHQLIGGLSHYLQGFIHPRWLAGFQPSTVSHQAGKAGKSSGPTATFTSVLDMSVSQSVDPPSKAKAVKAKGSEDSTAPGSRSSGWEGWGMVGMVGKE